MVVVAKLWQDYRFDLSSVLDGMIAPALAVQNESVREESGRSSIHVNIGKRFLSLSSSISFSLTDLADLSLQLLTQNMQLQMTTKSPQNLVLLHFPHRKNYGWVGGTPLSH